jgi:predicted 3-demethylubiquinone-9 3-methyltransferase (glyoxalase superfamily)
VKLLSNGGKEEMCGWLKDKYGLSWQIVPSILSDMMINPDRNKTEKVMQAVLKMIKPDIEILKSAYEN